MSKLGFLDSMKFSISPYENYSDKALLKTIKGFRESIEAGYDDDEIESELKEALLEARSRGLTVSKNPFGWLFGESKPAPEPEINFAEYSDRDLRSTINTYKDYIKADFGGERIVNSLKSAINEAKRRGFTDKSLLKMPTGTEEDLTDNEIKNKITTLKEYIKAGPPYDSPEIRRQLGETIEEAKRRGFTATGLVTANPRKAKMRRNPNDSYMFLELSDRAKDHAIEQYRNKSDFDWFEGYAEFYIDQLNEELQEYGIDISKSGRRLNCYWDVSFSQGSGLSFETDGFYPWEYIKKTKQTKTYSALVNAHKKYERDVHVAGSISRGYRGHNVSLNSDIEIYIDNPRVNVAKIEEQAEAVLEEMFEFCKDKMYETHKKLERAYLGDASIEDILIANEYKFDSNGNLV